MREFFKFSHFFFYIIEPNKNQMKDYYKDKQSGEIFTEKEMLDAVDDDDQLDSFYLIGRFKSKKEAKQSLNKK